jgi:hypothetical protein
MKTRDGFVSNSSSSNFMIIYRQADVSEIGDPHLRFMGNCLNEGLDYFKVDNDAIGTLIKENPQLHDRLIYVYFEAGDNVEIITQQLLDIANLVVADKKNYGKVKIEGVEKDYWSTDQDEERFISNYLAIEEKRR